MGWDPTQIIRKPLITEKGTDLSRGDRAKGKPMNWYQFEVDRRSNKHQIRKAVEELYNVRVVNVNTQNHRTKSGRTRFGIVKPRVWKKALVELHPEDRIELF